MLEKKVFLITKKVQLIKKKEFVVVTFNPNNKNVVILPLILVLSLMLKYIY